MTEQEWEDKLDEVQKHSENWYNKWKQSEEKIADIKANCDLAIEGRDVKIKELEKENAELKEKLKPENCLKLLAKEGYIKFTSDQLTKAKEIINQLLGCLKQDTNDPETNYYVCQYMDKAEQFLKEIEK